MPMDRLQAYIAIGGDIRNVVFRDDLTWPEIIILRHIHGGVGFITDIEVIGEYSDDERPAYDEPDRLIAKYGEGTYYTLWHRSMPLPLRAPPTIARFDDQVEEVVRIRRPKSVPAAGPRLPPSEDAPGPDEGEDQEDGEPPEGDPSPPDGEPRVPRHAASSPGGFRGKRKAA